MESASALVRQKESSLPYVLPFMLFLFLLSLQGYLAPLGRAEPILRVFLLSGTIVLVARPVLTWQVRQVTGSVVVGIAVVAIWIAPELLWPHYREHWLFRNALLGSSSASLSVDLRSDPVSLSFRTFRAVVLVPIVEELFWRAWLMRRIVSPEFSMVPLGFYQPAAFWITAALFATEHGAYWDVGLVAGIAYNAWMVKTRSLGDCILAHATSNALLSFYVIAGHHWQYWQ